MGDSLHRSQRGLIFERGDPSSTPRPFGERSEAVVLPTLRKESSGLAESPGDDVVASTWTMPKLSGTNCNQVSSSGSPDWGSVFSSLALFAND